MLQEEKLKTSRVGIAMFLRKFEETGSIGRRLGSGRPSKITAEIKALVEDQMCKDDETIAYQHYGFLVSQGYQISDTRTPGTMDGTLYTQIVDQTQLSFIADVYPDGQRFMANNDPKHTSRVAHEFLKSKCIGGGHQLNL